MIDITRFLTPYPEPNSAAGVNAGIQGLNARSNRKIEREQMAQHDREFQQNLEQSRETQGQNLFNQANEARLQMLTPLLQKYAALMTSGDPMAQQQAKIIESIFGQLGLRTGAPPGADQGLSPQENMNQGIARQRNRSIYGWDAPAYLPPVGEGFGGGK